MQSLFGCNDFGASGGIFPIQKLAFVRCSAVLITENGQALYENCCTLAMDPQKLVDLVKTVGTFPGVSTSFAVRRQCSRNVPIRVRDIINHPNFSTLCSFEHLFLDRPWWSRLPLYIHTNGSQPLPATTVTHSPDISNWRVGEFSYTICVADQYVI